MPSKRYLPLWMLLMVAFFGAIAISWDEYVEWRILSRNFMGLVFCQFSLLKLFNIPQFAKAMSCLSIILANIE